MAEAGFPGASNFRETDDSVEMLIDVPGVRPGDLKIEVEENGVRISGERKTEGSEMKFFRSFSTNSKLMDMSDAKADLVDGILTLTFAKKADSNPSPPKRNNIAITEGPSEGAEPGTGSNCKSIRKWGLPWPKKH
jgi:HSP20 family molecular chaperone IbpA